MIHIQLLDCFLELHDQNLLIPYNCQSRLNNYTFRAPTFALAIYTKSSKAILLLVMLEQDKKIHYNQSKMNILEEFGLVFNDSL